MRKFLPALGVLCLLLTACPSQNIGARYDSIAQVSTGGAVKIVANPTVVVCFYGSTTSNCQQNSATTYTDATLSTPCPPSTPLVLNGTTTCSARGDASGNFGFWVAPQQTYSYMISGAGVANTIYSFTAGGTGSGGGGGPTPNPPFASVAPLALAFGSVQSGTQSNSQPVNTTNTGSVQSISIVSASITGSSDFHLVSSTACNGALSAQSNCPLSVYFLPTALGAETATLSIVSSVNTAAVVLTGTGTATSTHSITVTGVDTGFGQVTSNPAGISCVMAPPLAPAGNCSGSFADGTSVILTATASTGSTFQSLNGASCSISPCTVVVASPGYTITTDFSENAPVNVPSVGIAPSSLLFGTIQTATDSPTQHVVISNTNATKSLTVNSIVISDTHFSSPNITACNGTIPASTSCVLSIIFTPTAGISYTGTLTVNTNAPVDALNPTIVALSGSGTATATFPLTVNAAASMTGAGTIVSDEATPQINCHIGAGIAQTGTCSANYASGSTPILTATADAGHTFSGFSGGGCSTSPCTVTVTAATTVTSTFIAPTPTNTLTVTGVGQGTGTVASDVNDANTGTPLSCTSTAGVLTGKCQGTFTQGTVVTLTETPAAGCTGGACTFTSWGGTLSCTTASTCAVTVDSNLTVSASFAANTSAAPLALVQTIPGGSGSGTATLTGNFATAQSAGDANIVYVIWNNNTSTISSITDTKGNTYTQAPGCSPKVATSHSIALYYSANILAAAAGANTITVTLSGSPSYGAIFATEYSGLTSTPFDACAGNTGSGTALSSGSFTSTVANDLLTGSDIVAFHITANSSSFTQQISSNGNDLEDRQGVSAAAYTFAPTQSASGDWATIGAAWKNGGGGAATTFNFNVICGPNGSGSVSASGSTLTCTNGTPSGGISLTVAQNSTQTLVANPSAGSVFQNYNGGGCGTNPTCTTSAITTNTTVTVNFALAASGGQNYYISNSGSDTTGTGTAANPWRTITKASQSLVAGSPGNCVAASGWITIPGVGACVHAPNGYAATGTITTTKSGTSSAKIIYLSDTRFGAVLTNPNWNLQGNYNGVYGFEMTAPSQAAAVIIGVGNDREVEFNYIHDVGTGDCYQAGVINQTNLPAFHDRIIGNIIRHWGSTTTCTHPQSYHGIYADGAGLTIENNVISAGTGGWGIQKQYAGGTDPTPGSISNNTIFNNQGGIVINEENGQKFSNWKVANNVIINNGVSGTCPGTCGGSSFGIDLYNFSGTGNLFDNNLASGNLPSNFGNHGNQCSPTNAACPFTNTKTDGGATSTFSAFVADIASAPIAAGSFVANNYSLKSSSVGVNGGSSVCVSAGITPCVPSVDYNLVPRPSGPQIDIGAFEFP